MSLFICVFAVYTVFTDVLDDLKEKNRFPVILVFITVKTDPFLTYHQLEHSQLPQYMHKKQVDILIYSKYLMI